MAMGIISIVHAVLAVFLIIELGLTAYMVDFFRHWTPSSYAFLLFCSVWSILMLLYLALAPRFAPRIYHNMIALGILAVTSLFWFAGATAVAARLGVPHCDNNHCRSVQAAIAFGYFIWAIFTGLTIMEALAFMRGRGHTAHADTKPGHNYGA